MVSSQERILLGFLENGKKCGEGKAGSKQGLGMKSERGTRWPPGMCGVRLQQESAPAERGRRLRKADMSLLGSPCQRQASVWVVLFFMEKKVMPCGSPVLPAKQ